MTEPCRPAPADIGPDSKVGTLLDCWPALEEVLLSLSPHFRALKNPILRKTVAKVATLRQVAAMGNVPLDELVGRLRAAAEMSDAATGQGAVVACSEGDPPPLAPEPGAPGVPPWATSDRVVGTHDARPDLARGEHPMPRVMAALEALAPGEVYALLTPLVPTPLSELARRKGFESASVSEGGGLVRTFFRRAPPG